jgi:tetratricopeptide (TPR) repeat protein
VVELDAFYIDQTEVAGKDYEKFLKATGCPPPDRWRGERDCPVALRESPVNNVSWFEAYSYARWAGKRLPSELEWEKAARGVDGRPFPWGQKYDPRKVVSRDTIFVRDVLAPTSLLVGRHRDGASPFGCLDMAGNVWEWTADREQPGIAERVIRGGASSSTIDELLTYRRKGAPPAGSNFGGLNLLGFRCARSITPGETIPELTEALTTGPDLSAAAEYYVEEADIPRARAYCERLLALNPRSPSGHFWRAACLRVEKKSLEALAEYRTVWFQSFTFIAGQRNLRDELGDLLEVMKGKNETADLTFLQAPAWFHQASHALDAGKHDEARTLLERVLQWDPENEVAHEQMAMLLEAKGETAEAQKHRERRVVCYRQALRERPDEADLHDQFAEFLLHHELDPLEAVEHARKATRLVPGVARYHRVLAECLFQVKDGPGALAAIREAVRLDPDDEEVKELEARYRLESATTSSTPAPRP